VAWAAFFNFISAINFGTGVAYTVGAGLVDLSIVTPHVVLAALVGAIAWDLLTWWWGVPTGSSHALFGGYAGAAIVRAATVPGFDQCGTVLIWSGSAKTI
jgi:PiT family inorganic phosphate transporter